MQPPRGVSMGMQQIALSQRDHRLALLALPCPASKWASAAGERLKRRAHDEESTRAAQRVTCEHVVMLGADSRADGRRGKHLRARIRRLQ